MLTRTAEPGLIILCQRCYTLGRRSVVGQALAVRDGRVLAVCSRRRALALGGRATRVVNLGAAVLTPALVDSHAHFFYWALRRALVIDVTGLRTLEDTLKRIQTGAKKRTVGQWVLASGFDQNLWGGGFPTAADLDRAVAHLPAMVRSRDGHTVWLNSAALREAGITPATPDPPGGRYGRDVHGVPTGIAHEAAIDQLPNPLSEWGRRSDAASIRKVDKCLTEAYRAAWRLGVVGVHTIDDAASLSHLQRHRQEGRLGLRVVHAVPYANLTHAISLGLRSGVGDEWLRIGGVKIFADGALSSQTAYMYDEYPGRAGYHGVPVWSAQELREMATRAARNDWPVWIHAIGDRAVHDAVEAIAAARRVERRRLAHRIEHAQCVRPADIRHMARLGIIASVQPCHLLADIATAEAHWPRARRNAFPLRGLLDAGVTLAAGSDVPIESLDPRRSFFAAVNRTDEHGVPAGGWFPRQKVTAEAVLRAFTRGAATAAGLDYPAGTLEPGAAADVTIWAADPLRVPPDEWLDVGILGCVVAGELRLSG